MLRAIQLGAVAYVTYKVVTAVRDAAQEQHTQVVRAAAEGITAETAVTPVLAPRFFRNADGLLIYHCAWFPEGAPIGSVVITHGYGEHCGRYLGVAKALNALGLAVFALDHQGHGQSDGDRAYVVHFDDYIRDVLQYIGLIESKHPELVSLPRFLLGHSMGGTIAAQVAAARPSIWTGVILSAPALVADPKVATPTLRAITKVLSAQLPKLQTVKLVPHMYLSHDKEMYDHYARDPLVYFEGVRARWGHEMSMAMDKAVGTAAAATYPILLLHGTADRVVLVDGSRAYFAACVSQDKTLREYEGGYHELFQETDEFRTPVVKDLVSWIAARLRPAPTNLSKK